MMSLLFDRSTFKTGCCDAGLFQRGRTVVAIDVVDRRPDGPSKERFRMVDTRLQQEHAWDALFSSMHTSEQYGRVYCGGT